MEELTQCGNVYTQSKSTGCTGCAFDDIEDGCVAQQAFYNLCIINKTIWIKKEQEMEEYTDKNGIVYKQKPEDGKDCMGCAFDDPGYSYACGESQCIKACGASEIIWVKKEQEMNTEVTQDTITEFTAPSMLKRASDLMIERAVQYDSPEGERSMEKIVAAFNAITGKGLTESEGWMLMVLLKLVRDNTRDTGHQDSCEDLIAYGALYGESRLTNKD